jgi:hypothetical protein
MSLQQAISSYGGSLIGDEQQILIAHDFCQISYNGFAGRWTWLFGQQRWTGHHYLQQYSHH